MINCLAAEEGFWDARLGFAVLEVFIGTIFVELEAEVDIAELLPVSALIIVIYLAGALAI